jgi:hypothetical protein
MEVSTTQARPTSTYLPIGDSSIRVLQFLTPDVGDADASTQLRSRLIEQEDWEVISSDLEVSNLRSGYCALSYVWGTDPGRVSIDCDDKPLSIRRNLHEVLLRIQSALNGRDLWVDALCINQADDVEKSKQVQRMGIIFKDAEQVLVWLGEGSALSQTAWWVLQFAARHPEETALTLSNAVDTRIGEDMMLFRFGDKEIASSSLVIGLQEILSFEWFHRAWTYQEVVAASKVVFCCGSLTMDLDALAAAFAVLSENGLQFGSLFNLKHIMAGRLAYRTQEMTLSVLLQNNRLRHAIDPRDKVYSLLGLLDTKKYNAQVSYLKSPAEVYKEATLMCLQVDRCLSILFCAGLWSRSSILRNFKDKQSPFNDPVSQAKEHDSLQGTLPSWVPDWRGKSMSSKLLEGPLFEPSYNYSGRPAPTFQTGNLTSGNHLQLRGWAYGNMRMRSDSSGRIEVCELPSCAHVLAYQELTSQPQSLAQLEEFFDDLRDGNTTSCECFESLTSPTSAAPFLIDKHMVPYNAQSGDWLCVFDGRSELALLRPVVRSLPSLKAGRLSPTFSFVGLCHGILSKRLSSHMLSRHWRPSTASSVAPGNWPDFDAYEMAFVLA